MRGVVLAAAIGLCVAAAGCGGDGAAACRPTVPPVRQGRPPAPFSAASFNYGTRLLRAQLPPGGRLPAGKLPDGGYLATIERDGSISTKLGWWRGLRGPLRISGRRLDRRAAPLRTNVAPIESYGATGFLPTILSFPTTGCWRVTGRVGRARLSFVLDVTRVASERRAGTASARTVYQSRR